MKDVEEGYERPGLDAILNLLAGGDRRVIVHGLRQRATGETTVDDLAEFLVADGLVTENDSERPPSRYITSTCRCRTPTVSSSWTVNGVPSDTSRTFTSSE